MISRNLNGVEKVCADEKRKEEEDKHKDFI